MALYRVLERSFINNALVEEGATVEYDGEVASNLELIKKPKTTKGEAASQPAEGEAASQPADSLV
jgi:hypothetical protein